MLGAPFALGVSGGRMEPQTGPHSKVKVHEALTGVFSPVIYTLINLGPVTWGGADFSFAILSPSIFLTVCADKLGVGY